MPQLRYVTFDGEVHTRELKPGTTRLGRTPDNDLQIDELAVSSRHCALCYDGKSIMVQDLDSVAGTYVEGEPITEQEIKVGQVLSLGTFLVYLENSNDRPLTPPAIELRPVHLPDGSYSCLRHPTKRALFECPECFDLACQECVTNAPLPTSSPYVSCRACGASARAIDWSGLTMTKKEAAFSLLPRSLQRALEFWENRPSGKQK